MKILLVGANQKWSIERHFVKYMTLLGAEFIHFPASDIIESYRNKNIINKILFRTKIRTGYAGINKELLKLADRTNPDLIWVFKGMEIFPETLKVLRKKYFLANYNPDNPFIFSGRGSGNKNVTDSIGLYNLHFTYSRDIEKELNSKFPEITTKSLPFGYDLNGFNPDIEFEEIIEPCFVGNPDVERAKFIQQLNDKGIRLNIYGHKWNQYISTKLNNIHPAVNGDDYWKTIQKYRVQLNIMRIHNLESHNMRTFEIAPVGGVQLIPRTIEHQEFYKENEEAFFYENIDDAVSKINFILSLPKEKVDSIRKAALKRAIESGYSYKDRAANVFETFKNIV